MKKSVIDSLVELLQAMHYYAKTKHGVELVNAGRELLHEFPWILVTLALLILVLDKTGIV